MEGTREGGWLIVIRDDFQMDPPPPPASTPPEGNLNNCQMPRATAAGRYHVLSWLASSQASFVVRVSPNPVLLPFSPVFPRCHFKINLSSVPTYRAALHSLQFGL